MAFTHLETTDHLIVSGPKRAFIDMTTIGQDSDWSGGKVSRLVRPHAKDVHHPFFRQSLGVSFRLKAFACGHSSKAALPWL